MYAKENKDHKDRKSKFTENLKSEALELSETCILILLSSGDIVANQVYYHKDRLKRCHTKESRLEHVNRKAHFNTKIHF